MEVLANFIEGTLTNSLTAGLELGGVTEVARTSKKASAPYCAAAVVLNSQHH